MKTKCNCAYHSPFKWYEDDRPSIFANDVKFRPHNNGLAFGANGGTKEELERILAKKGSFIHGISRNKEAELLRLRTFMTYSAAKPSAKGK
jgi:hypothetical protein